MNTSKHELVKSMRLHQDFIQNRTEQIPAAKAIASRIIESTESSSGNKPPIRDLVFDLPVKLLEWKCRTLRRVAILLLAIITSLVVAQINGTVRAITFVATWGYMIWNLILVFKYYLYNFSDLNGSTELFYGRQAVGYDLLEQIGTAETQTCEQLVDALKARLVVLAKHIINNPDDGERTEDWRKEIKSLIIKAINCRLICKNDDPDLVKSVARSFYEEAFRQAKQPPK